MDLTFINTVLRSVNNVMSMAQVKFEAGKPKIRDPMQVSCGEVTGVISISGKQARASVALTFSKEAILIIADKMLPGEHTAIDHVTIDLAGELANMVLGDAKRQLEDKGKRFTTSLPVMIYGQEQLIAHKAVAPIIVVPFQMEKGTFCVEAVYEELK